MARRLARYVPTAADKFSKQLLSKAESLLSQGSDPLSVVEYFKRMGFSEKKSEQVVRKAYDFLTNPIRGK